MWNPWPEDSHVGEFFQGLDSMSFPEKVTASIRYMIYHN